VSAVQERSLRDERIFLACLVGLAVAIGVFLVLPLTPGFVSMHRLPTNRDWHIEGKDQGGVGGFWLLSVAAYGVAIWQWRRGRRPSWRLLIAGVVVLHALALLVPPVASEDVYAYSFYGLVQRTYGTNPYLAFPDQHPLHPWYPFWSWRDIGPVYGPPFLILLRGVATLAGSSLLAFVVWTKLLLVAAELAAVWLLVRAVPRSDGPGAGEAGWPVLLIAWNPMVLQSIAMSAHVDALLLLLVAGAALAHRRGRHLLAFVLLVAGFNVKLYMGPLAALYALWMAAGRPSGHKLVTLLRLAGLGVLLSALAYLPYASAGRGLADSVLDVGGHFSSGSLGTIVRRALTAGLEVVGVSQTSATAIGDHTGRTLALVAVAVWLVVCARRILAVRDPLPALATYFLGYLLLTPWVFYWHEVPLLALVAVIPWSMTSLVAIVLGMSLMPSTAPGRAGVGPPPSDARELVNTLVAFVNRYGAPVLVLVAGWVRRRGRAEAPPEVTSRR
jgi:hypothetical protein